jgi:hypothetical protein
MMLRSHKTLVGVIAVGLVGVVAAVGFAAWSVGTTLAAPLLQVTATPNAPGQAVDTAGQYATYFLEHFASHLGLSVDQVKTAYSSAYNDTIDQMVKDGRLTQSQADQLKQKAAQGVTNGKLPGFGPGFRGGGMGGGMMGHMGMLNLGPAEFAKALGMTQTDLQTELKAGKSIADVAKEKNLDINQVKQTVLADVKTQLDTAVKNNQITQAQADQRYQQYSQMLDQMVTQPGLMRGRFQNKPNRSNPAPSATNTPGVGL